jgi:transposase-like protein
MIKDKKLAKEFFLNHYAINKKTNISSTAKKFGVSRTTIYEWIKEFNTGSNYKFKYKKKYNIFEIESTILKLKEEQKTIPLIRNLQIINCLESSLKFLKEKRTDIKIQI